MCDLINDNYFLHFLVIIFILIYVLKCFYHLYSLCFIRLGVIFYVYK